MSVIPSTLIDLSQISRVKIGGRGGKEEEIRAIFRTDVEVNKVNHPLYDYEVGVGGQTYYIEVKKQANTQWFDVGKYCNLTPEERNIILVFLLHRAGEIDTIVAVKLGDFVSLLTQKETTRESGWTEEVLATAADLKNRFPKLQFKVCAKIRDIVEEHSGEFQIVYHSIG